MAADSVIIWQLWSVKWQEQGLATVHTNWAINWQGRNPGISLAAETQHWPLIARDEQLTWSRNVWVNNASSLSVNSLFWDELWAQIGVPAQLFTRQISVSPPLIGQDSRCRASDWQNSLDTNNSFNCSRAQEILEHDAQLLNNCPHNEFKSSPGPLFKIHPIFQWKCFESQKLFFWFCWYKLRGHNGNWFLGRTGLNGPNILDNDNVTVLCWSRNLGTLRIQSWSGSASQRRF